MSRPFDYPKAEFYVTSPSPCPYLAGKQERKVFSFLGGPAAPMMNAVLTRRGFRRSQNIVYMPSCDACSACKPVRLLVKDFEENSAWRRILKRNRKVERIVHAPKATSEQFSILRGYLDDRHADGGMADMTVLDYTSMVEQTSVDTILIEYRLREEDGTSRLIACALTDRQPDGLSMVYSFFEPEEKNRSLGSFMILDHIRFAEELGLDYVYLGYWVQGSPKMDYKARFQPLEYFTGGRWKPMLKVQQK